MFIAANIFEFDYNYMGKTNEIYWEFIIYNKHTPIDNDELISILDLDTAYLDRGASIKHGLLKCGEYHWMLKSPTVETFDGEEVLTPMLNIIEPCVDKLAEYIRNNGCSARFCVVVEYYYDSFPGGIGASHRMIDICHKLNADIDPDIYIMNNKKYKTKRKTIYMDDAGNYSI